MVIGSLFGLISDVDCEAYEESRSTRSAKKDDNEGYVSSTFDIWLVMPFTAMAHGCLNARKLLDVLAHTVKMNYYFFLSRYANQYKLACKHLMILVHGEVLYVPPKIK